MAPSADQFLHYMYGEGSAASCLLLLVTALLVSAVILLSCTFCNKSKEVNLIKSRRKRPMSELKRVTIRNENGIREINGEKNGAITASNGVHSEEKKEENNETTSPRLNRVLPPPPENSQSAPPTLEVEDPLYDTVKDLKEQAAKTAQDGAMSNNKDVISNSEAIDTTAPVTPKLERINPLYVSVDEVKDSPSNQETTPGLPTGEHNEKAQSITTQVSTESLYAVVCKKPSMKNKPPQNPEGEENGIKESTLQKIILLEELSGDHLTVDLIPPKELKPPNSQSSSEKVDAILSYWNRRSVTPTKLSKDMCVNLGQEAPPLVPVKRFDVDSEINQHTIEEDTEIAREQPTST